MSVGSPKSLSPSSPSPSVSPESASPVPQCGCDDQAPATVWVELSGFTDGTACFMCDSLNGLYQCDIRPAPDGIVTTVDSVCCAYRYHFDDGTNEIIIDVFICYYFQPTTWYSIEVKLTIDWDTCQNFQERTFYTGGEGEQLTPYDCDNLEEGVPFDVPQEVPVEDCQIGTVTVYGPNTAPI